MRGKDQNLSDALENIGITPAYAGKSPPKTRCRRSSKDHPRLCGEKGDNITITVTDGGSPPPMRGKEIWQTVRFTTTWITPAYAGKSPCVGLR